ncbi:MAG TPA: serine hydrolase [Saprospiraceae bacterium]|nr:serine hydrolase [Saprospiraceae bacterium]
MKAKNFFPFTLILCILAFGCKEEEPLMLNPGEVKGELHEANLGKIKFTDAIVPYAKLTEKNFLSTFGLRDSVNLNLLVFLAKTQTYFLHELAPELSVNELCKKGSYQISFYVDGQLTYLENLQTGAGSCWFRNEVTVFRVPLLSTTDEEHWGRYLWIRFLKKGGGEKALSEGTHQLKIEMRPYIKADSLKVGPIIAEGAVQINTINKIVAESEIALQPIAPVEDWPISEATFDEQKIRALNEKIAQNFFKDITSIVVARNGELLLEEYFNGANRNTLHDTRSVGKSFASTIMGIALKEGHIKSKMATLKDFYKLSEYNNNSNAKGNVSIQSLLTMSSGFMGSDMDPDSPGNEEKMYPTSNWVKFALDLPMDGQKTPGKDFDYFTAGAILCGDILNQKAPGGLETYAAKKLFQPLGIKEYQWQYTPQNVANTAGGLQMNALNLARFGQLYKNGGAWNGQQIIPKNWVEESLSRQIVADSTENIFYGYLFWNKSYTVAGKAYEVAFASGNGGNKVFIFKDLPIVVVITATAFGQPFAHFQVDQMMEEYILPALIL